MIGDESVFHCVSGMPFGKHLRMGVDCRQSQLRGGSDGKEVTCNEGGLALIPGWGRSPEEGNGNPLQYSCLENPIDREAGRATVHGVTKCRRRLSNWHKGWELAAHRANMWLGLKNRPPDISTVKMGLFGDKQRIAVWGLQQFRATHKSLHSKRTLKEGKTSWETVANSQLFIGWDLPGKRSLPSSCSTVIEGHESAPLWSIHST